MHTVVETRAYLSAASDAGMSDAEREAVVAMIAANPDLGDGGARKLRFKRPGTGKSGGYRVITYYADRHVPVFLLTVFGKNERANLNMAERNALAKLTKTLADSLMRQAGG